MNRTRGTGKRGRGPARWLAGAGAFALALGVAGCGGGASSGDGVTLRFMWWGNPPRHQATNEAIKLYEQRNPNVDIKPIYTGWDGYWDKLATQIAGGNSPDVMQMDYAYLAEYGERNSLLELQEYTSGPLNLDGISEKVLASGKLDGTLYAVPWSTNTQTFTVDASDISAAGLELPDFGMSWQDFREFGKKLSEARGEGKFAVSDMSTIPNVFEVWLGNEGKALYDEQGRLGFSKADLREYWTYWQGLVDAGIATPADIATPMGGSFDEMALVRDVAEIDYLWDNQFSGIGEYMDNDVAMMPLPTGQQTGQYLHPSMFLSAAADTEHPEEAAKFIDFMVTNMKAGKILGTNRGIPADETVREKLASKASGLDKKVFEYEEKLADRLGPTPPAPPKGNSEIEALFTRMGENIGFGRMSIDQAVNTFFTRAESILAE